MRTSLLFVPLLATLSCHAAQPAPKLDVASETIIVQREVGAMSDAQFAGDTDTLLRYSYPAVVEKAGGPAAFSAMYKGIAATQDKAGVRKESVTFPSPPEFIEGESGRWFVLVPRRVVASGKTGARGAVTGFLLGVREADAEDWTYVPGPYVRPDFLVTALPDFPAGHPLPPIFTENLPPTDPTSEND